MIEGALQAAAEGASLAIKGIAVLLVAWGSIEAAVGCMVLIARREAGHGARKVVWRRFGVWLLLGLEFELAADIIETVISPQWIDIAQLGAIAVIRTFLNYFLEKDLEASVRETGEAMRLSASRAS
ncbi:MAG TPA: DUF1622 domain-containing protein [Vicinamibacterales bacterium]|nr:DUF1622 domain-containing protein [Vicinamibacterales bacterium]